MGRAGMKRIGRRSALGLVLLGAACGGRGSTPPLASGAPSYRHLTPLRLDVAALDIAPAPPGPRVSADPPSPIIPAQAMLTMAEDRLSANGRDGLARFIVQTALLTRRPASGGGLFSSGTERLDCVLRCRLELRSTEGELRGFAEAEVRRDLTQPAADDAASARNAESIVSLAMADLNVEFEFQVRRNLRTALLDTERAAPAPEPVEQEALPR